MSMGRLAMSVRMEPLRKLQRESPKLFEKAEAKGAIAFLNWCNLGSGKASRKPPIRWGVLRGSSSALVAGKIVFIFPQSIQGGNESVTPARSFRAEPFVITWVWNTDYATKMHEWEGGWGKFTLQDTDAGNQWLMMHLQADKDDLMTVIAKEYKALAGT